MNESERFEPTVPSSASPMESPHAAPVPTEAPSTPSPVITNGFPAKRTWQESLILLFQVLSIIGSFGLVFLFNPLSGSFGQITLWVAAPFGLLGVCNLFLFAGIIQRSAPLVRGYTIAVMVVGLILTVIGATAVWFLSQIGSSESAAGGIGSLYASAVLIFGFTGSIFPFAYYQRILGKR